MREALADLVRRVGDLLVSWRTSGGTDGAWEGTQFHARADVWAHEQLCEGLARIDGSLPVVSEESAADTAMDEPSTYWLIDPIDGTASYAGGFEGYVTQVALMVDGRPALAAVAAPRFAQVFIAESGRGAYCNGVPLTLRSSSARPVVIDNTPRPVGPAAAAMRLLGTDRYRESGSLGLKICRVADGSADLFVKSVRCRDWDLAAPELVLREVGGVLVNGSGGRIVYGGPRRHQGLIAARSVELAERVVAAGVTSMTGEVRA